MSSQQVELRFVGSGDAFGSGGRLQTCILVRGWSESLLIDCGASSLIGLRRDHIDPNEIDSIFISHLHGDHFGGVPFFILDARLVSKRERPLVIAGPPGLEARIVNAMEILFPRSSTGRCNFPITFIELEEHKRTSIGKISVTAFPVVHFSGAPSYALRAEIDGRTIAYSGDTEWTSELIQASSGADLFICEAYSYDKVMKFHLDYHSLKGHRHELTCKRLILTHMNEDSLSQLSNVEVETAHDRLVLRV